jgi:hypothetical protein
MKTKTANPAAEELLKKIQLRAYLIWESEGKPGGREKEHWHRAEAEILGKTAAIKTTPAKKAAKTIAAAKTKRTSKTKQPKGARRGS